MSSNDPYRFVASRYDRIFESMNRGLRAIGLQLFPPTEGMSVLDVGCGTGIHLDLYRSRGCRVSGIDASRAMLDVARMRLGNEADLRLGDASNMPYSDGTFDLAVSMLVLHEMKPAARIGMIQEVRRVLKKSGRLLLIDYHPGPYRPLRGWLTKGIIAVAEIAAGREHFRNYRHFMSIGGLPSILRDHSLKLDKERIVGGGTLAVFLASRAGLPGNPSCLLL